MYQDSSKSPGKMVFNRRFLRDLLLLCTGGLLVAVVVALLAWNPLPVTANPQGKNQLTAPVLSAPQAPPVSSPSQTIRNFYLTYTDWSGSLALSENVCLDGYHMASAWEILDTSNLHYYRHGNSYVQADSGHGPPSNISGWVRTGVDGDTSNTPGSANCNNWSEEGGGQYGTTLWLPSNWANNPHELHFWEAQASLCSEDHYVWCIQDAVDVSPPMRQFYLTEDIAYNGAAPDGGDGYGEGVCSLGYHFASMFELVDPSNLQYNPNLGATRTDSGMGPPSGMQGWIGTGGPKSYAATSGSANCYGWDTSGTGEYGTVVTLQSEWSSANNQYDLHIWDAGIQECVTNQRVWCVADEVNGPGSCAQPAKVSCGQLVRDNAQFLPNHLDTYSCVGWNESGPEKVYALTLPEGWTYDVTASVESIDPDTDLDIFFLTKEGCAGDPATNTAACDDLEVTQTNLAAGTYYIVVDGYNGAYGEYYLEVECTPTFTYLPNVTR